MQTTVTTITPETAAKLLKGNTKNRKIRKGHVRLLSSAMKNGEWKLSPQPIIIGRNGRLLDGQHRLLAIVDSGTSQLFSLTENADESIFDVIDIGAKRNYSDISGLSAPVSGIITSLATIDNHNHLPTPQSIHKFADAYEPLASELCNMVTARPKVIGSAGLRASAVYMAKKYGLVDYVFGQYKALATFDYKSLSPVAESFMRLVQRKSSTAKQAFSSIDLFSYGVKVFDHREKNKQRVNKVKDAVAQFRDFNDTIF